MQTAERTTETPVQPSRRRQELRRLAEISGLCGFAIALPTLDVLGRNPDFLFLEHLDLLDVVLLALASALLPPLALWGFGLVAGLLGERVRHLVHLASVAGLLILLAVQVGKNLTGLRGLPLAAAAVVVGVAAASLYRYDWMRTVLRVSAPVPLLAVALFLFVSPASVIVLPEKAPATSAAGGAATGRPPIVVLAFDEFPLTSILDTTGKIDAVNYPNFAWLAERSTWYRNATGITTWTRDAYPSMLTGRWPSKPLVGHYRNYPDNLFTLLDDSYDLNVHEVATVLCPPQRCESGLAPPGRGPWRALKRTGSLAAEIVSPWEHATEPTADFSQPVVPPRPAATKGKVSPPFGFTEFLEGLTPSARPKLSYIHMLLPHRPWKYLPSGLRYPETRRTLGFTSRDANWGSDVTWPNLARHRHRLQLAYADRLLGQTLMTLQHRGLLDKSVVVVTADHGISFLPGTHPRVAVQRSLSQLMWVPMFIKAPGQDAGRVDDRNYEQVDLLPTLAEYAGVKVPWTIDGSSALGDPGRPEPTKRWYIVRDQGPPTIMNANGPAGLAVALKTGTLPPHPDVKGRLGADPGLHLDRLGLRPDLVGDQLARHEVTDATGPPALVQDLELFDKVDLDTGEVPALVVGVAPAGVAAGTDLALALNGRIATVARVAPEGKDGALRFGGIIPGELFASGANELEVLLIDGDQLRRLPLQGD